MLKVIIECLFVVTRYLVRVFLDDYVLHPLEDWINRHLDARYEDHGEEGGESATEGYDGGSGGLEGMEASGQD